MTKEELEKIERERGVKVRAIDIRPYHYSLPCIVGGHYTLNGICIRSWSEDGKKISFMLDSHNFLFAKPDEDIFVVPDNPAPTGERLERILREDAKHMNRSRGGRRQ